MISAVIGLQYGDEGKGRYLDYLLKDYDVSIRFNGGANAGHQCYINNKKYSVHLVPTGIFRNKKSLIANECVLNPISFCQ
jgi:adenylosuccinate synthase